MVSVVIDYSMMLCRYRKMFACAVYYLGLWEPDHGARYPSVQVEHGPQGGPGPFPDSCVRAGVHEVCTFTWTKRQFSLFPSSSRSLQSSFPRENVELKVSHRSLVCWPPAMSLTGHSALAAQPWPQAPDPRSPLQCCALLLHLAPGSPGHAPSLFSTRRVPVWLSGRVA